MTELSAVALLAGLFLLGWWMVASEGKRRQAIRDKWDAEHPPHLTWEQLQALIELADERLNQGEDAQ